MNQTRGLGQTAAAFANIYRRRVAAKRKLENIEKEYDALAAKLLDQFTKHGMDSVTASGITAYLHRQVFAHVPAHKRELAIAALKRQGLGFLAPETINYNTLCAWVREQEEDRNGMPKLPRALKPYIDVVEKYEVRGRKK